jgi:hypothetical protein
VELIDTVAINIGGVRMSQLVIARRTAPRCDHVTALGWWEADKLACEAWTKRMLALKGPAQPSPTLGDALNAGYLYLEVR